MNVVQVLFSPNGRMQPAGFWLGVFILAVVSAVAAYASATRPDLSPYLSVLSLGMIYVYVCVYGKRFHDKGLSAWMALIPFGVSLLVSFIAFFSIFFGEMFSVLNDMAVAQGVDTQDQKAFTEWMQSAETNLALQKHFQDPETASALLKKTTIPGQLGFWIPSVLFGFWVGTGAEDGENKYGPDPRAA